MTNLPKDLQRMLANDSSSSSSSNEDDGPLTFGSLRVHTELVSRDGTVKRAYELGDGQLIESVLMAYDRQRVTACISSQAGCAMGCKFCGQSIN